jgi:hypothetical protein
MVQPYLSAVDTEGETAVLVFGGEVSHAARKSAVLAVGGGGRCGVGAQPHVSPAQASEAEVALARQVVGVVRSWGHELLYARVDMLPGPVLVELEVTEPSLFMTQAPGSEAAFARAVRRAVERC